MKGIEKGGMGMRVWLGNMRKGSMQMGVGNMRRCGGQGEGCKGVVCMGKECLGVEVGSMGYGYMWVRVVWGRQAWGKGREAWEWAWEWEHGDKHRCGREHREGEYEKRVHWMRV